MRNLIRALRGKPVELSPKQEEKMAKARARADAQIAAGEAQARKAHEEYAAFQAARGITVDPPPAQPPSVKDMFKQSFEQARESVGATFDDRRDVLDPGPGADLNRPPAEVEDPGEREAIAQAERAARDAARAPFRTEPVAPVAFTRVGTNGREQLDHVASVLATADPAQVFGVYRVPDRFDLSRNREGGAYVEWELAHVPGALSAPAGEVATTALGRDTHLVQRAPGEESVLDEDVIGALIARAGLDPHESFGLTRLLNLRGSDSSEGLSYNAYVEGVLLFSRPLPGDTHATFMRTAPHAVLEPAPFHLEILDWEAVAAWVAPWRWGAPRTPSPLPHLPSSWQELLIAYLEIVGVRSEDCYGVQATRTREGGLADLSLASFRKNFTRPKLPSADGRPRERLQAAEHVVLAYRDSEAYRAGRERWRAYQDEVLRARLDHLTGVRPRIAVNDNPRPSFVSEVFDMFNPFDPLHAFPQVFNRNERPSLGPYCGRLP